MTEITKKSRGLTKKIDSEKDYVLSEAADVVKTPASAKFDKTVEIALELNVDPRHADQMVHGSVVLPAGTGKRVRVTVIAEGAKVNEAQAARADIIGNDDLVEGTQKGNMNFDVLIATPNLMSPVGRVDRTLGPKGLMPNPKTDTVTMGVAQAVHSAKSGRVNFRIGKQGNIHAGLEEISFTREKLLESISTFAKAISKHKPAATKGRYVKNAVFSLTMSPSIKLEV